MSEEMNSAKAFKEWFDTNKTLTDDLQNYLFYQYTIAEGKFGDVETSISVADLVVYISLFYLSVRQDYRYNIIADLQGLTDMLDTTPEVVVKALDSLQEHKALHYSDDNGTLDIHIVPIEPIPEPHDHEHECCGGHHHDEDHECCGGHHHDEDHECCSGHGHDEEHECCGGHGHDDDHECCGGHDHEESGSGCGCGKHA